MDQVAAHSQPAPAGSATRATRLAHGIVMGLFIVFCAAAPVNRVVPFMPAHSLLLPTAIGVALAACLVALVPELPWLNVLLAAGLAAFIGGLAHSVSAVTGLPFGRGEFHPDAGPKLLGLIPWWLPVAWAVLALSARGTARSLLYQSRDHRHHGYRVILLAAALAMLTSMVFHVSAVRGGLYWTSEGHDSLFQSSGHVFQLFIQIAITPLMIDKYPGHRPPNFRPLLVLAGVNVLFATEIFRA